MLFCRVADEREILGAREVHLHDVAGEAGGFGEFVPDVDVIDGCSTDCRSSTASRFAIAL